MKGGEVTLRPPDGCFPGVDRTLAEAPGVTREAVIDFEWNASGALTVLYRVNADDMAAISAALDGDDWVTWYDTLETEDGRQYALVRTEMSDLMGEVLTTISAYTILFSGPFEISERGFRVTLVGQTAALQEAHDAVTEHVDLSIQKIGPYDPEAATALSSLTDRQREALETAYDLGFYESPRKASYEDIAAELDCVPSAANDLLRRSESALIASVLGH